MERAREIMFKNKKNKNVFSTMGNVLLRRLLHSMFDVTALLDNFLQEKTPRRYTVRLRSP